MEKMLVDLPLGIETKRLILRSLQPGDGRWYFEAGQRNRAHLQEYEADNVILEPKSEQEAEILVRELAAEWARRNCFFMAAFETVSKQFVAQVYIGPLNWELPEFEVGYFCDIDHQRKGFVTDAIRAVLAGLFEVAGAHRVRLQTDESNLRSRQVAERCGFSQEGKLRETKRKPDGTFNNELIYGLLKQEFAAYNPQEILFH